MDKAREDKINNEAGKVMSKMREFIEKLSTIELIFMKGLVRDELEKRG